MNSKSKLIKELDNLELEHRSLDKLLIRIREEKTIDLLDEDKPISGQKYVCISFISPENIIKQKNFFFLKNS